VTSGIDSRVPGPASPGPGFPPAPATGAGATLHGNRQVQGVNISRYTAVLRPEQMTVLARSAPAGSDVERDGEPTGGAHAS
jgi:hypothetical protein